VRACAIAVNDVLAAVRVAWRIAADVAIYRLRKREAGNLATSLTLAVALGLGPADLASRAGFGALLNLFVYLVNDCFDVGIDLRAPGRDNARTRFLAEHLTAAWATVGVLTALLVAWGALHSTGLLLTALVNVVVIVVYSRVLKHRPLLDLVAMAAWGLSMAMVGFPLNSATGWRYAGLLAILCMVTEAVQVLRDESSDRAAHVRTTAVVLGPRVTAVVARVLLVAAAVYAAALLHPVGAALALGALVSFEPDRANASWDRLRALFGLTWLALLALLRWHP
jgi:4-hydroxybenzoate polyprenyltransferase